MKFTNFALSIFLFIGSNDALAFHASPSDNLIQQKVKAFAKNGLITILNDSRRELEGNTTSAYGYDDTEEAVEDVEKEEAAVEEDSNAYGSSSPYGYEDTEDETEVAEAEEEDSNAYEEAYGDDDAEEAVEEGEEAVAEEEVDEEVEQEAQQSSNSNVDNMIASNLASFASGILASIGVVAAVSQVKRRYAMKKDLRVNLNPKVEESESSIETAYAMA